MRVCPTKKAAGKRLARSVIGPSGGLLLAAGTVLTSQHVRALLRRGVRAVAVEQDLFPGIEVSETVCAETQRDAAEAVKRAWEAVRRNDAIPAGAVRRAAEAVAMEVRCNPDLGFVLSAVRMADEFTYKHLVDVCVYSLVLGKAFGLGWDDLVRLGVGALLHDIGKARMPELTAKPGPLSEEERARMKEHPEIGFRILRDNFEISLLSAHVALQHHEKWDGSGYPRGLKGSEIHEFGLVAAVADTWCALVSERPYRKAMHPVEAARILMDMAGSALETGLVRKFLLSVAWYPTGSIVLLEDGRVGVVTGQDPDFPERPEVAVVADLSGRIFPAERVRTSKIRRILPDWPKKAKEALRDLGAIPAS